MSENLEAVLKQVVAGLSEALGDNLNSCCLYGSAVRGNFDTDTSDINLLILLNQSDVHAHIALASALQKFKRIDPFVLAKRGFERSFRMFSPKFASIQRHYRVLFGADPLVSLRVKPAEEQFLTEQAFRNLRLRLVYAFVTRHHHPNAYQRFIVRNITPLFVQLSDILRLNEIEVPIEFRSRVPLIETQFKIDGSVLYDLLELKTNRKKLSDKDETVWHERLFPLIDRVLVWIEENWPSNLTSA
jgi:predicted nucleotidyltransferase